MMGSWYHAGIIVASFPVYAWKPVAIWSWVFTMVFFEAGSLTEGRAHGFLQNVWRVSPGVLLPQSPWH